jgi:hypothetical protein
MKKFGLVFWAHLLIIILIWLSPFVFSWKIILVGIGLYYFQLIIFGDCILTKKQFKTNKRGVTFYSHLLTIAGFQPNLAVVRIIADYVMPWIILGIALLREFYL